MKCSLCLVCLTAPLLLLLTSPPVEGAQGYISAEERSQLIEEAIAEAKTHTAARASRNQAAAQSLRRRKPSSADILKLFKKASTQSLKIGTAQLEYEDMVRRAERKLAERERAAMATSQTTEEKAEAIAQELFHVPGSMLTSQEIAHMYQESTCLTAREVPDCTLAAFSQFRTIDGTCNNLENPLLGAANTAFRRLIPGQYEDGISSLHGENQARLRDIFPIGTFSPPYPSPRFVSDLVIQDRVAEEMPFTHILMQWGQFLDHDLDLSPELEEECDNCTITEICHPIHVSPLDETFGLGTLNNGDCLSFHRSLPSCSMEPPGSFAPREQINSITSYIDGSMVYGSTPEVEKALREFEGGLLRVGPNFPGNRESLPVIDKETAEFIACPTEQEQDCFLCGDARCNEQISLTLMHLIWVREHNRCARELAKINPQWGDERLYQECRRIVGALIQKITYADYLPKVFGVENYHFFVGPYLGYIPTVDASIPNAFATAAYRYGHSLIRPQFDRLNANFKPLPIGPLNLVKAFFNPSQFKASLGTDPIVRGLVNVNSLRMDEFLNSVLTTQLFQTPSSPGLDLASLNMQRGRDHGLPPYLAWRNFCSRVFEIPGSTFENFITNLRFIKVYGSLDTVDLWIGGLAENRLKDSLLGATFACIFGLTFANVRNGDSFYYTRPGVFTPSQLEAIRQDTLSRVLCDNLDDLREIQPDAFLSNQTRLPCSQIPSLNLEPFREEPCFFRVRMEPRPFAASAFTLYSSLQNIRFFTSTVTFPPSSSPMFECAVIECPTSESAEDVIVYSNLDMFDSTTITSDPNIPSSTVTGGAYVAQWDRPTFDAGEGGVFTSRSACEGAGNVAALDISFSGASKARAEQDDGGETGPSLMDLEWTKLPEVISKVLKEKYMEGSKVLEVAAKAAAAAAEVQEKEEEGGEAVSDKALIQELENALKQI